MKHLVSPLLAGALLLSAQSAFAADSTAGVVDFGKLAASSSGAEFVEVHIKSNVIGMAARLVEQSEPEIAEMLRGLKQIRVNVIGLGDDNRTEIAKRVAAIRSDLDSEGWESVVTVRGKDEDIRVHLKTRGEEAIEGLVVTMLEKDREAILVNVVGNIQPDKIAEKLTELGERFDIEPLKKLRAPLEKD